MCLLGEQPCIYVETDAHLPKSSRDCSTVAQVPLRQLIWQLTSSTADWLTAIFENVFCKISMRMRLAILLQLRTTIHRLRRPPREPTCC